MELTPIENVRMRLNRYNLSQKWLNQVLAYKDAVVLDPAVLSKIITGVSTGEQAVEVISLSNKILDEYEVFYKSLLGGRVKRDDAAN